MRRALSCVVGFVVMLVVSPVAGAATWSAQSMVIPQTVQGTLFSVSCGSPTSCEGVGQTVDANGNTRALAEAWNGTSWRTQTIPSIDAPITYLSAVSCSSPSSCVAVGSFQGSSGMGQFSERWDGSQWAIQILPNLPHTTTFLNAISCSAANSCLAVGVGFDNHSGAQSPVLARFNSSGWHIRQTLTPSGSVAAQLTGVSCTSTAACTAVGEYANSSSPYPFPYSQSHTASGWQLATVPFPSGALGAFLNSVSCSAANGCTTVGTSLTDSGESSLAARWNGTAWSLQTVPNPQGAPFTTLSGVSCASASACTAVGGEATYTSSRPVAMAWDGSAWHSQTTPAQPGGFLGAVSCPAATSCTAIGTPSPQSSPATPRRWTSPLPRPGLLTEAPSGSWFGPHGARSAGAAAGHLGAPGALTSGDATAPSASLYRAPSTAAMTAALTETADSGASLTLIEHWDGTSWTIQPNPALHGAAAGQEFGVSCGSPTSCFATGFYLDNRSGTQLPLLEHWDGTAWKIQSIPTPAGAPGIRLFDVSCTSPSACMAVGEAVFFTSERAFADRWDGTKWTLQEVPGKAGYSSALGSVSCTAANACTAVGALLDDSQGTLLTLADVWNGTRWTVQPTANHSGNTSSYLYGVSCTGSSACMAVGNYNSNISRAFGPLTERRSGTTWQLEPLSAPPNLSFSLPGPVSCTAADACTAVGTWFSFTSSGPLAVRWDGTSWSSQPLPSSVFDLYGVSCASATTCVATGDGRSATWNGTSWSSQSLAYPNGNFPTLGAVACRSGSSTCIGVGSTFTGQPEPLAEIYS